MEKFKMKMTTFIIVPYLNECAAPGIAVTVADGKMAYSNAIIEAKKRSRLSDFDNWKFI